MPGTLACHVAAHCEQGMGWLVALMQQTLRAADERADLAVHADVPHGVHAALLCFMLSVIFYLRINHKPPRLPLHNKNRNTTKNVVVSVSQYVWYVQSIKWGNPNTLTVTTVIITPNTLQMHLGQDIQKTSFDSEVFAE